jgi:SAM-dependent methyltransferase
LIEDVPSPIDFSDIAQARAWVADTVARRPGRPRFFEAFTAALNRHFDTQIRIAELGSGPGHLAEAILRKCRIESYAALDRSPAMHRIAREHLGELATRVRYILADFRAPSWARNLGEIDALGPVDKPRPDTDASEQDESHEAGGELIISGGDATLLLEMPNEALNP